MYRKRPENFSLAESSTNSRCRVFLSTRGPKIAQPWRKLVGVKRSLYKCVYQIWGLYIIFEAMKMQKKAYWYIFGCKVGKKVSIGMQLDLDMWHHILNVYSEFQIDISRHVEKKPGKLLKIQNAKIIAKIHKLRFLQKKKKLMSRSIQRYTYVPQLKNLSWLMRTWLQKINSTCFWL